MYECRFPVEIKQMTCTICKYPATCRTLFWLAANRENLIYIFILWWVPQTEQNRPRSEFTCIPINCPIYIVVHYPVINLKMIELLIMMMEMYVCCCIKRTNWRLSSAFVFHWFPITAQRNGELYETRSYLIGRRKIRRRTEKLSHLQLLRNAIILLQGSSIRWPLFTRPRTTTVKLNYVTVKEDSFSRNVSS